MSAAESVLVRTILWFYSHEENCRWVYADAPPYDAVLIDALHGPQAEAEAQQQASDVLRLTGIHADPGPDTLQRPITAEKLRSHLLEIQALRAAPALPARMDGLAAPHRIEAEPAPEPLPPLADTDFAPLTATFIAASPARQPPAAPPADAAPAPAAESQTERQAQPELPADAPRQRLKRWPRAAILRGDPHRVRMAALLSRRALNAHDLMLITGFSAATCQVFLQVLQSSELLSCEPAASWPATERQAAAPSPVEAPAEETPAEETPPATPKTSFTQSLIAGFRRRLGL